MEDIECQNNILTEILIGFGYIADLQIWIFKVFYYPQIQTVKAQTSWWMTFRILNITDVYRKFYCNKLSFTSDDHFAKNNNLNSSRGLSLQQCLALHLINFRSFSITIHFSDSNRLGFITPTKINFLSHYIPAFRVKAIWCWRTQFTSSIA